MFCALCPYSLPQDLRLLGQFFCLSVLPPSPSFIHISRLMLSSMPYFPLCVILLSLFDIFLFLAVFFFSCLQWDYLTLFRNNHKDITVTIGKHWLFSLIIGPGRLVVLEEFWCYFSAWQMAVMMLNIDAFWCGKVSATVSEKIVGGSLFCVLSLDCSILVSVFTPVNLERSQ